MKDSTFGELTQGLEIEINYTMPALMDIYQLVTIHEDVGFQQGS